MEHVFISLDQLNATANQVIHHKENNLDKKDNINELPDQQAVYAICGRVNGQLANCRFVGATDNLQKSVRSHFEGGIDDACVDTFFSSIKTKMIVYKVLQDSSNEELEALKKSWTEMLNPVCNEELNEVF